MGKVLSYNDQILMSGNSVLEYSGSEVNSNIASTTLVLKGNGSGDAVAATPGTDYVVPSALSNYVPTSEKGANNGVATLDSTGKVPASQLRGGFVISSTAPNDTSLLWIDNNSIMWYYNNSEWHSIIPTWG